MKNYRALGHFSFVIVEKWEFLARLFEILAGTPKGHRGIWDTSLTFTNGSYIIMAVP